MQNEWKLPANYARLSPAEMAEATGGASSALIFGTIAGFSLLCSGIELYQLIEDDSSDSSGWWVGLPLGLGFAAAVLMVGALARKEDFDFLKKEEA